MTITRTWGPLPRVGLLLTASCLVCGGTFRTVLGSEATATRCGVDHRCGTGVIGPVWTLIEPPAARSEQAEAAA